MKLIATRALRYNTRGFVAGDEFEASDMHARLLVGIRKARYAPDKPPLAAEKPKPQPPLAATEDDIDQLRGEAQRLGIEIDGRWGTVRLKHEIAQVRK